MCRLLCVYIYMYVYVYIYVHLPDRSSYYILCINMYCFFFVWFVPRSMQEKFSMSLVVKHVVWIRSDREIRTIWFILFYEGQTLPHTSDVEMANLGAVLHNVWNQCGGVSILYIPQCGIKMDQVGMPYFCVCIHIYCIHLLVPFAGLVKLFNSNSLVHTAH